LPFDPPTDRITENHAQIVPCGRPIEKDLKGEGPGDGLSRDVEVFDRALAVDPSQRASRDVLHGTTNQL
jgi:hypothetical protein